MLETLRGLRGITTTDRGCTRVAYTAAEDEAHAFVWDRLRSIDGLARVVDAAGNLFVVPESATVEGASPIVLVGSHVDTVIEGGWLDGTLGVAAGMHVLEALAEGERAHAGAGLVVFRDEEGVRFNTGLFGSRVYAGLCTANDLDVRDRDGTAVRSVVPDPAGCLAYEPPVPVAAFLECHIEQGMRLVDRGARVGVVTGIVGIRRYELTGIGVANHAGTTEMRRRRDALVPVASVVGRLPPLVADLDDAVITCGRLTVRPGAPNVVPGTATAVIECRAHDRGHLDLLETRLADLVTDSLAGFPDRGAGLELTPVVSIDPTPTDRRLGALLENALERDGIPFMAMPSMAGHDTQHAARRGPAGMFFIPSIGGISHNPEEDSTPEDITVAGDVMLEWVRACLA